MASSSSIFNWFAVSTPWSCESVRVGAGAGPAPATAAQPPPVPPQGAMLAWYTNRAGYLMAIGRPAAQVGLYHPANSMWLGDEEADRSTTKIGWQLFEHQVEWDYFDEQSLSSVATIADGGFKNLSGQVYRAIVVPSSTVITRTGLERFRAFVKAGGKVIFVGKTPTLVVDKTFRDAKERPTWFRRADRDLGRYHAARAGGPS